MPIDFCIVIDENGDIQTLYDDCLHALGTPVNVARASLVEPNSEGTWDVVLSDDPRNGQYRGHVVGRGFERREDALAAEVAFIIQNILGVDHGEKAITSAPSGAR